MLIFIFSILLSPQAFSYTPVIRSPSTEIDSYRSYLLETNQSSFSQEWLNVQRKVEMEDEEIDQCLGGNEVICHVSIEKSLQLVLTATRAETLMLLIEHLKNPTPFQQNLFINLIQSYSHIQPYLKKKPNVAPPQNIPSLHYQAWLKLLRNSPQKDALLLVNGKEIKNLAEFHPQEGFYQWSLISNTHKPLVVTSSWAQFADLSLKTEPLFDGNCEDLKKLQPKKMGLFSVDVFINTDCHKVYSEYTTETLSPHLTSISDKKEISSKKPWIWTALAVVAVGLAYSLKDKDVTLEAPGAL